MLYREKIDKTRIPAHIAIIMDGNGRWAKEKGQARTFGHQAGAETVHVIAEESARLGVKFLTLYTFSTENWNRPTEEVDALMHLIAIAIEKETPDLIKNNVRLKIIGDLARVPEFAREKLEGCVKATEASTGMNMILAISYSARWEITNAVKKIASDVANGKIKLDGINEETVGQYLTTAGIPPMTICKEKYSSMLL